MGITLPILILALPFFMFLLLGIGGVKMSRKVAGILGILGMGTTMTLAFIVAFTYFFSGDAAFIVDGVRQQYQVTSNTWYCWRHWCWCRCRRRCFRCCCFSAAHHLLHKRI